MTTRMIVCWAALLLTVLYVQAKDSLPPLQDGRAPQNLKELWGDYDPTTEPLEVNVVREWEEDGVVVRYVTFTVGTFKGEKSTMSAFYAFPKGEKNLPAIMHIHGGGQRASLVKVQWAAWNGYAGLSVNWGGHPPLKLKKGEANTDWGALDPTQRHNRFFRVMKADGKTLDAVESPRNNNWFILTLACRRGITFLEQQPEVDPERIGVMGHSMGGKLTVDVAGIDPRVKAAVPSCGGSGSAQGVVSGMPGSGMDKELSDLFLQTIDNIAYIRELTCPILYMGPSNDFAGPMDNMYSNWKNIGSSFVRYAISPHLNHHHDEEFSVGGLLLFEQFLKNNFDLPNTPKLSANLHTTNGIPRVTLVPDASMPIEKVDIYYSVDPHVLTRFWRYAEAEMQGDAWVAECPVMSTEQPLFVYANVTYEADLSDYVREMSRKNYENKFALSSNMLRIMPEELKDAQVVATDSEPERLIDDFKHGWRDWYRLAWGTSARWVAGTRKLKDPKYRAPKGAALLLDVQSPEDNTLVFEFTINWWRPYPGKPGGRFTVVKNIKGSPEWQTIQVTEDELAPSTLKQNDQGKPEFRYTTELTLSPAGSVVENGELTEIKSDWQGPVDGQFRDLRWSGGVYPDDMETSSDHTDITDHELNKMIRQSIDDSLKE